MKHEEQTKTVLRSDGESEWVEIIGGNAVETTGDSGINWIGDGRTRREGGPTADQAMKMAREAAEAAKDAKDAEVAKRAADAGICPIAQKIIDHAKKGWLLKRNSLGGYRMDGPGRFDGSFSVSRAAAESAIEAGVALS